MCDLICDVITCCVEAAIRVKLKYLIKIMFENQEKKKIWK